MSFSYVYLHVYIYVYIAYGENVEIKNTLLQHLEHWF